MPRTIQCDQCGIILNLPENSGGKRLKCPKCGSKFAVGSDSSLYPTGAGNGVDASVASSSLIESRKQNQNQDISLPLAPGDLRETFDLSSLTGTDSGPLPLTQTSPSNTGDALLLFEEKKPAPRRKLPAEARAEARRCPTCRGVVPVGMSICSSCGLDLESGHRTLLDDDDLMPSAPVRAQGLPIPVTVIALVSLVGSLMLAAYSAVQWLSLGVNGFQYFVPICLFGTYSAAQLLRGRSAKLLIVALTLAAVVDLVALIAMPIYLANEQMTTVENQVTADDDDLARIAIQPITARLDSQRLSLGIAGLLLYAGVTTYLASPSARRGIERASS